MSTWAIVVAGGRGDRFGEPKQFTMLGERRVIDHAVALALAACDGVVVVLPAEHVPAWDGSSGVAVAGGATRSGSVRNGLAAVPSDAGIVVVHDAARPFATRALFDAVIGAVDSGADAAYPGVAVVDTLRRVRDDGTSETVDRSSLFAVQTPQAFVADALRRAHAAAADATDDIALVEAIGGRVMRVPGDPRNLKITSPEDLDLARALAAVWRP